MHENHDIFARGMEQQTKVILTFYYSERGTREEIDPVLSQEGERFLRGVRIDVAPGVPATQRLER